MTEKKIMFIGQGLLGAPTLDLFLRDSHKHECLVAGRNLENVRARTNLSVLVAAQLGFIQPSISSTYMDVNNIDQTAESIAAFQPDIIFSSVALQSWIRTASSFPKHTADQISKVRRGSWMPMASILIYKLMQAVKKSGLNPIVINASYPDIVHSMLHKSGLGTPIGVGNVSNCIPALRLSLAHTLNQPVDRVDVRLFATHVWSRKIDRTGNTGDIPFHLTVLVDGEDWTQKVDLNTVFKLMITKFKRPDRFDRMLMSAASSITVLEALANDRNKVVHAPGPNGLPGGYPVRIDRGQISIELPLGLSLNEAIRINEKCQQYEGIECIDKKGVVHFTDEEVSMMKNTFGYEKKKFSLEESEECAKELGRCWNKFVKKIEQGNSIEQLVKY